MVFLILRTFLFPSLFSEQLHDSGDTGLPAKLYRPIFVHQVFTLLGCNLLLITEC
jgi:hypothetical protein